MRSPYVDVSRLELPTLSGFLQEEYTFYQTEVDLPWGRADYVGCKLSLSPHSYWEEVGLFGSLAAMENIDKEDFSMWAQHPSPQELRRLSGVRLDIDPALWWPSLDFFVVEKKQSLNPSQRNMRMPIYCAIGQLVIYEKWFEKVGKYIALSGIFPRSLIEVLEDLDVKLLFADC